MGVASLIVMYETIELTEEQAQALLESGFPLWENERQYLSLKANGVPFRKMRFPRYMVNEMAVLKSTMLKNRRTAQTSGISVDKSSYPSTEGAD